MLGESIFQSACWLNERASLNGLLFPVFHKREQLRTEQALSSNGHFNYRKFRAREFQNFPCESCILPECVVFYGF